MLPARNRLLLGFLFFGCLLCASFAIAQETYDRTVIGQVVGNHGEPVGGADVTLKNLDRGTVKHSTSDFEGGFRFSHLSTGANYEVFAEYQGKRSQVDRFTRGDRSTVARATLTVPTDGPATHDVAESHDRAIVGRVFNASGQPMSGVRVILKNSRTGVTASRTSDREGAFRFMHLSTKATYSVRAQSGASETPVRLVDKNDHDKTVDVRLEFSN
jgi:hypothetical protein